MKYSRSIFNKVIYSKKSLRKCFFFIVGFFGLGFLMPTLLTYSPSLFDSLTSKQLNSCDLWGNSFNHATQLPPCMPLSAPWPPCCCGRRRNASASWTSPCEPAVYTIPFYIFILFSRTDSVKFNIQVLWKLYISWC